MNKMFTKSRKTMMNFLNATIVVICEIEDRDLEQGYTREHGMSVGIDKDGQLVRWQGVPSDSVVATVTSVEPNTPMFTEETVPESGRDSLGEPVELFYADRNYAVELLRVSSRNYIPHVKRSGDFWDGSFHSQSVSIDAKEALARVRTAPEDAVYVESHRSQPGVLNPVRVVVTIRLQQGDHYWLDVFTIQGTQHAHVEAPKRHG